MNAIFNLIRETDQLLDVYHREEAGVIRPYRLIERSYTISAVGISTLGFIASSLEFYKDPISLVFRRFEVLERVSVACLGIMVRSTPETRKVNRLNIVAITNLFLYIVFPQYKALRFTLSILEAAGRLGWIYDRYQGINLL